MTYMMRNRNEENNKNTDKKRERGRERKSTDKKRQLMVKCKLETQVL